MLETILQLIASATISAGIIAYLAKVLVKLWIDKDLESHKSNLTVAVEKELASFRNKLSREYLEHQVRFTKTHEMQAQILGETYSRLKRLLWSFNSWLGTNEYAVTTMADKHEKVMESYNELFEYFDTNAIWLDNSIEKSLGQFLAVVSDSFKKLANDTDATGFPKDKETWKKTEEYFYKELPDILSDIEASFRNNLGVENPNKANSADTKSRAAD